MKKTPLNAKPEFIEWLGDDKTALLVKLDQWPMEFVAEKLILSGHSTKENVSDHILWYKQFMSFKGIRPSVRSGMFSDIIDGVWHQHILFTHDYERFGNEIFGYFIHHVPCNIMDVSPVAMKEYGTWLTDYEEAYGHLPADLAAELASEVKCTYGDAAGLTPLSTKCTNHGHGPDKYKCT